MTRPRVWNSLDTRVIDAARFKYSTTPTIEQYFAQCIPSGDAVSGATSARPPVHQLPAEPCQHPGCSLDSTVFTVEQHWPQTLFIVSDARADTIISSNRVKFTREFRVLGDYGDQVDYLLVGRVLFHNSHFTSQLLLDGRAFTYNDMDGKLIFNSDPLLLETPSNHSVYYAYHRVSKRSNVGESREQVTK